MFESLIRISGRIARAPIWCSKAGNVIPMVAAATIPMIAIVGGGLDMSRVYLAKSRLQQACDAGVLAGRKTMGASTGDQKSLDTANEYFNVNFPQYSYGVKSLKFNSKIGTDGTLRGNAVATMPSVIMNMFGHKGFTITANCGAAQDIANIDVTMVLDTTGSMSSSISGTTRIKALQNAVINFYDQMDQANQKSKGRIRYAFVPYSSTVNVGSLLVNENRDWVIGSRKGETAEYMSRGEWFGGSSGYRLYQANVNYIFDSIFPGKPTYRTITNAASPVNRRWEGCIEERQTVVADTVYYDRYNDEIKATGRSGKMYDMDIDLKPNVNDDRTRWTPYYDDIYDMSQVSYSTMRSGGYVVCPEESRKLTEMTRAEVSSYVNSLTPKGGTYHDIGLLWGARLTSTTGIFANNVNETPGNNGAVQRHLLFMTDGELSTSIYSASAWGIEYHQKRITGNNNSQFTNNHRTRFLAVCEAVKARGIRLWVIAFATSLNNDLKTCASSGSAFEAKNSSELNDKFAEIARKVADLRLTE